MANVTTNHHGSLLSRGDLFFDSSIWSQKTVLAIILALSTPLLHPFVRSFYGRIIGLKSMTLAEGKEWREMRKTFNPSFAAGNMMALMPAVVEQGEISVGILSKVVKAGGFVEDLDKLCRGFTIDIIFRVVLGLETSTQLNPGGNEVVNLLERMGGLDGESAEYESVEEG